MPTAKKSAKKNAKTSSKKSSSRKKPVSVAGRRKASSAKSAKQKTSLAA